MPGTQIQSIKDISKRLTLLTAGTGNGHKASIFLELLGLDYDYKLIDFSVKKENYQDWFVKFNPNSKIPTLLIVDEATKTVEKSIFESAAILIYLADTYDKENKYHYPLGHELYYEQLSWTFFQMASLGPQQGQANHFNRFAPEKVPYGIKRYTAETNRLYDVLEAHLEENKGGYMVGDKLTYVDVLVWPWVRGCAIATISLENRPHIQKWFDKISELDAFKIGVTIG